MERKRTPMTRRMKMMKALLIHSIILAYEKGVSIRVIHAKQIKQIKEHWNIGKKQSISLLAMTYVDQILTSYHEHMLDSILENNHYTTFTYDSWWSNLCSFGLCKGI